GRATLALTLRAARLPGAAARVPRRPPRAGQGRRGARRAGAGRRPGGPCRHGRAAVPGRLAGGRRALRRVRPVREERPGRALGGQELDDRRGGGRCPPGVSLGEPGRGPGLLALSRATSPARPAARPTRSWQRPPPPSTPACAAAPRRRTSRVPWA